MLAFNAYVVGNGAFHFDCMRGRFLSCCEKRPVGNGHPSTVDGLLFECSIEPAFDYAIVFAMLSSESACGDASLLFGYCCVGVRP